MRSTYSLAAPSTRSLSTSSRSLKTPLEQLQAVAVKYEADEKAKKVMHVSMGGGASANRTDSCNSRKQRQQPYKGGNKDNYVCAHFKKLEADGRCNKCGESFGAQGLEAHKKSYCKAMGGKSDWCVSKNMGGRARKFGLTLTREETQTRPRSDFCLLD